MKEELKKIFEIEKEAESKIEPLLIEAINELPKVITINNPIEDINHSHIGFPRDLVLSYYEKPEKLLYALNDINGYVFLFHLFEFQPRRKDVLIRFYNRKKEDPIILKYHKEEVKRIRNYCTSEIKSYCGAMAFPLLAQLENGNKYSLNDFKYKIKWKVI